MQSIQWDNDCIDSGLRYEKIVEECIDEIVIESILLWIWESALYCCPGNLKKEC